MVCGGKSNVIFKDSSEFSGECRGELWSSVRDEGIMESEAFEYMVEKELGDTVRVNSF